MLHYSYLQAYSAHDDAHYCVLTAHDAAHYCVFNARDAAHIVLLLHMMMFASMWMDNLCRSACVDVPDPEFAAHVSVRIQLSVIFVFMDMRCTCSFP